MASRSFAANTASGRSPADRSRIASPAARPSSTVSDSVSITSRVAPGSAPTARRAPVRRSATWRMLVGPPTNAMRRRPVSSRWRTASSPPTTSSTDTDERLRSSDTRSTSTTGVSRALQALQPRLVIAERVR